MGEVDNFKKNKFKHWKTSVSDYSMNEIKQDEGLGRVCMLKPIVAGQEGEGSTQESDSNSGVNQSDEKMPALGDSWRKHLPNRNSRCKVTEVRMI